MAFRIFRPLVIAWFSLLLVASIDAQSAKPPASTGAYQQAEILVKAHHWDEGLSLLQPLLRKNPQDLKALNLAGLAYTGKGDLRGANDYFQKALRIRPDFVPALKNMGVNEYTLRDYVSSEKHLNLVLRQLPEDPVANLYAGEIAYTQGRFKQAAEELGRAPAFTSRNSTLAAHLGISLANSGDSRGLDLLRRMQPGDVSPETSFSIGLSFARADRPEDAVPFFESLHNEFPSSYTIGFNLLVCYLGAKKSAEAISLGEDLIRTNHDTDEVESVLAQAFEQSGNTPKAVDALRRAIELAPENENNYLDFANLCIDHRDLDNGLKVIGVGLKVIPDSSRLMFERGVLYAMQDRFELAEQDFQRSARLAPESDFGYVGMGVQYLETGNAAKAIEILRQRLVAHPDDASLLYLLGEALMRGGAQPGTKRYAEAQAAFEHSIRANPGLCLPHVALGDIYVEEERYKDAISQLEKARAIDPKEKSVYWHLAVAYRKVGRTDNAKQALTDLKNIYQQEQGWLQNRMKPQDSRSVGMPKASSDQ